MEKKEFINYALRNADEAYLQNVLSASGYMDDNGIVIISNDWDDLGDFFGEDLFYLLKAIGNTLLKYSKTGKLKILIRATQITKTFRRAAKCCVFGCGAWIF